MTTVPIIFSVNYASLLYLQHNPESISNINILIKRYWGSYLHSPDGNIRKSGLCLTKDGVDRKQSGMAFPWPAVSTANTNMYVCVCPQCSHLDLQPKESTSPILAASCWLSAAFFSPTCYSKCFIRFGLFLLAVHVSKCYLWMYFFCLSSSFLFIYM